MANLCTELKQGSIIPLNAKDPLPNEMGEGPDLSALEKLSVARELMNDNCKREMKNSCSQGLLMPWERKLFSLLETQCQTPFSSWAGNEFSPLPDRRFFIG